jgi:hypothetical protein
MTSNRALVSSAFIITRERFRPESRMTLTLHNPSPEGDDPLNKTVVHRRVEITVEREVISVVYQPAPNISGRCEQCGKDVLLLSADAAAASRNISAREIYRWLDENKVHFQESPAGAVFICSESLKTAPPKELP